MAQKNCIIILNISNFTGTLNHIEKDPITGEYKKIRVDYKQLLEYLANDRYVLGAYVVSQQAVVNSDNPSVQNRQISNQKFLQKLKKFGWTPLQVAYSEQGNANLVNFIWQNIANEFIDEEGKFTINEALTDVVFVNGSASWFEVIQTFFNAGFKPEVSYIKAATSKHLLANFAFDDITSFLIKNNLLQ